MTKYTPGPYFVDGPHLSSIEMGIIGSEREDGWNGAVATMNRFNPEVQANTRLLVAAPEMYELLKEVSRWVIGKPLEKIDAIVAKVEGA